MRWTKPPRHIPHGFSQKSKNTSQSNPLILPTGYDEEAQYFEAGVRKGKRQELLSRASAAFKTGFDSQVQLLQQRCLTIAKEAMAQTESDSSQFLSLARL